MTINWSPFVPDGITCLSAPRRRIRIVEERPAHVGGERGTAAAPEKAMRFFGVGFEAGTLLHLSEEVLTVLR